MKLLIVCATVGEFPDAVDDLEVVPGRIMEIWKDKFPTLSIRLLVTGAGMVPTTYFLLKELASSSYDLVIQTGIAGCFHPETDLGTVYSVQQDCFAWWGSEDGDDFQSVFKLGLQDPFAFPFTNGQLVNPLKSSLITIRNLPVAKAITVNTVHGQKASVEKAVQYYNPDIESMEGAAFFFTCLMQKVHCLQIRAVSNLVEKRNRKAWNIPLALSNLSKTMESLFQEIAEKKTI